MQRKPLSIARTRRTGSMNKRKEGLLRWGGVGGCMKEGEGGSYCYVQLEL
jgi:hypothetical protein